MTSNEVLALATEYSATEASAEERNILLVGTFYCIKEIDEKNGKRLDINLFLLFKRLNVNNLMGDGQNDQ